MQCSVEQISDSIKKVLLNGRLDIMGSGQIETQFTAHAAGEKANVMVDLSGVSFLASIGLRLILSAAKGQMGKGGKLVVLAPTQNVKEVLTMAGVSHIIPIFDQDEDAKAYFTN